MISPVSVALESNHAAQLRQSVQSFFSQVNWDDHSPEVQEVRHTIATPSLGPISLTMSVSQFFAVVNWDGTEIAAPSLALEPLTMTSLDTSPTDSLTLDDFFNLF